MFLEPHFKGQRSGWIEVICGSMFSGKTEELIRRLKRAKIAGQRVEIFKPKTDNRYDAQNVVSHDANTILATPIEYSSKLLELTDGVSVVGIVPTISYPWNSCYYCWIRYGFSRKAFWTNSSSIGSW